MSKYINWYTVELERRLKGRLPQQQLEGILSETESHLLEATADEAEEYGRFSEQLAVRRFGTPYRIAQSVLNANDPPPPAPWRASILPGIAMLGLVGTMIYYFEMGWSAHYPVATNVAGTLNFFFAAMLIVGLALARQVLRLPLLVFALVGFFGCWGIAAARLLATGDPYGPDLLPRHKAAQELALHRNELKSAQIYKAAFDAAEAKYSKGAVTEYLYYDSSNGKRPSRVVQYLTQAVGKHVVPSLSVRSKSDPSTLTFGYYVFDTPQEALGFWKSVAKYESQTLDWQLERSSYMVRAIPEALEHTWAEQVWRTLPFALVVAGSFLGVAWLANLIVYGLYSLSRVCVLRRRRYA